ncbi:hypothetical protein RISK_001499 [Rhodopirellula islandica]|uniref:Uncharacterized protein n=1 Tax=Rhodopirellula islandica TaxID=595434 RepID=A0A0J1BIJ9_RHOIS|nr:hypothetical protein RISK_001499 [Rhodopirellula islandica]
MAVPRPSLGLESGSWMASASDPDSGSAPEGTGSGSCWGVFEPTAD